ncbi:MAG TPA: hypothetical protein VIP46_22505 [Pyrinomonadaceae bacterium]
MPIARPKEDVDAACALYAAGLSMREIESSCRIDRGTVYKGLRARGVELRTRARGFRVHDCDDQAFESDSEARDYWIGMMMADGSVYMNRNSYAVELGLNEADAEHLYKFKSFLKAANPVRRGGTKHLFRRARIVVYSKGLFDSLARFGVTPRKSLTAKVKGLENSRHFWRGVVDGDGCIYVTKQYGLPTVSLVGSRHLLEQFLSFVRQFAPSCRVSVRPKGRVYSVQIGGRYGLAVIQTLYSDCVVSLSRKQVTADKILSAFEGRAWRVTGAGL